MDACWSPPRRFGMSVFAAFCKGRFHLSLRSIPWELQEVALADVRKEISFCRKVCGGLG
jgi:hypothetical protein